MWGMAAFLRPRRVTFGRLGHFPIPTFGSHAFSRCFSTVTSLQSSRGVAWASGLDTGNGNKSPFAESIPGYVDHFGLSKTLADKLEKVHDSYMLNALISTPGTGKRSTVREAARQLGAAYVHLSMRREPMQTIIRAMEKVSMENYSTGERFHYSMCGAAKKGLHLMIKNIAKEKIAKGFASIDAARLVDGVEEARPLEQHEWDAGYFGLSTAMKMDVEKKLNPGQLLIFHVDDVEVLAVDELIDVVALRSFGLTPSICSALIRSALADGLTTLGSEDNRGTFPVDQRFRVILTGSKKPVPIFSRLIVRDPLCEATPQMVKRIVETYVTFPGVDEATLSKLVFEPLCGPVRNTQYFLDALWECGQQNPDLAAAELAQRAVEAAYNRWMRGVLVEMKAEAFPERLAYGLFLAMTCPEAFWGWRSFWPKQTPGRPFPSRGYVFELPYIILPRGLSKHSAGCFQFCEPKNLCWNGTTWLLAAYPFLRRAITVHCGPVEPSAADKLLRSAELFFHDPDAHLDSLAALVLALEAGSPASPLFSQVLLPTPKHSSPPELGPLYCFGADRDMRVGCSAAAVGLAVAEEVSREGDARLCDVVLPLRHGDAAASAYVVMKAGRLWLPEAVEAAVTRWKQALVVPDSFVRAGSVFAVLSLHPTGVSLSGMKRLLKQDLKGTDGVAVSSPFVKVKLLAADVAGEEAAERMTLRATTAAGVSVFIVVAEMGGISGLKFWFDPLGNVSSLEDDFLRKKYPQKLKRQRIPGESQEALLADLAVVPEIASLPRLIRAVAEAVGFTEAEVEDELDTFESFYGFRLRLARQICELEEREIRRLRMSPQIQDYFIQLKGKLPTP